jgi:hypothetical protein
MEQVWPISSAVRRAIVSKFVELVKSLLAKIESANREQKKAAADAETECDKNIRMLCTLERFRLEYQ